MWIFRVVPACLLAFVVGSCGSKDNNSSGGTSSELDGNWIKACSVDESSSSKETLVLAGGVATNTSTSYSDTNCTTEVMSMILSSSYTLGAALTTPAGSKEITKKISKIVVTLKDDTYVSLFNGSIQGSTAICGGGFVKNVAKDLNASTCSSDATWKKFFEDSFDVYKLDGTKLYMGLCGDSGAADDCSTAAKRPTTLETDFYTKN